jgi:hypothetical protein
VLNIGADRVSFNAEDGISPRDAKARLARRANFPLHAARYTAGIARRFFTAIRNDAI